MFTRISKAILTTLAVAGCSGGGAPNGTNVTDTGVAGRVRIACALDASRMLARQCGFDVRQGPAGATVTLWRPDGGFRRLLVVPDGRALITADGAEAAIVRPVAPDEIDVVIASDTYRIPIRVRPPGSS